jgi:hypothetical protein
MKSILTFSLAVLAILILLTNQVQAMNIMDITLKGGQFSGFQVDSRVTPMGRRKLHSLVHILGGRRVGANRGTKDGYDRRGGRPIRRHLE